MGHANLNNLSEFFVKRLYAKGRLTLKDACVQAAEAGHTLQASEGEYEEPEQLAIGFMDIIHYLSLKNPRQHHYSGPDGGGPWIVADLSVWIGNRKEVTHITRMMLDEINAGSTEALTVAGCADRLEEEGFAAWGKYVRINSILRLAYKLWQTDSDKWEAVAMPCDEDWCCAFDYVPWVFAHGWRRRYREVPMLGNVTH